VDEDARAFYRRVFSVLRDPAVRHGDFVPLEVRAAGAGDLSFDGLVAFAWRDGNGNPRVVVVVNLREHSAWARIPLGPAGFASGRRYRFLDRLDGSEYVREGDELGSPGLFVALRANQSHLLTVMD
jgi:hypothetical protein